MEFDERERVIKRLRERITELEAQLAEARRPSKAVRELIRTSKIVQDDPDPQYRDFPEWEAAIAAVEAELTEEESNV